MYGAGQGVASMVVLTIVCFSWLISSLTSTPDHFDLGTALLHDSPSSRWG